MEPQRSAFSEVWNGTAPDDRGLSDEEFKGLRLAVIDEMAQRPGQFAKPKTAKQPKRAKEQAGPKRKRVAEKVDPPDGAIPAPGDGDAPKPWEMDPAQLRAEMDRALWPTDDSNHTWVPRPPMSLSDFLRDGI